MYASDKLIYSLSNICGEKLALVIMCTWSVLNHYEIIIKWSFRLGENSLIYKPKWPVRSIIKHAKYKQQRLVRFVLIRWNIQRKRSVSKVVSFISAKKNF